MATRRLTQAMDGSLVEMAVGDHLFVELPENGTTGYVWEVERTALPLAQEESTRSAASTSAVGAGGTATFAWTARTAGEGVIRLKLWRPWEKAPIEQWEATVRVT